MCCVRRERISTVESITPTLNQLTAAKGRLPKNAGECFVDIEFLEKAGYSVGDTITFFREDEDAYKFAKGLVDLTEMVNDKILTSMPYTIYCKDDCKGLCPTCGANLNHTDCNCAK